MRHGLMLLARLVARAPRGRVPGAHLGLLMLLAQAFAAGQAWAVPEAKEIMEKNFYASKPMRLFKEVTMTLINERGELRIRKIAALSSLQDNGVDSNMLVRFIEPADIKGTAFLQLEHSQGDDDQWVYLPALHKSRRLVSSNRKDSFMGSDFAYGDVLPPKVSLYQHRLLREEPLDAVPCYVIESVPVNEDIQRDYGYSRKISWIAQDSYHEVKTVYFDVAGRLLKTQLVQGIVLIDVDTQRWAAKRREMANHQTNHRTIVTADRYTTAVDITPSTYTLRSLERD